MDIRQKGYWIAVDYSTAEGVKSDTFNCPDKRTAYARFRAFADRETVQAVTLYQGSKRILHVTAEPRPYGNGE